MCTHTICRRFTSFTRVNIFIIILVLALFPGSVQSQSKDQIFNSLIQKADSLISIGKYNKAEAVYKQAMVFNKNATEIFKGFGKIAYKKEDWPAFHRWYNKVLKIDPNDEEAIDYLTNKSKVRKFVIKGDSLRTIKYFKQAERSYQQALKLDDKYIDAMKGLANVAYAKKDWKKFRKWVKKALEIDSADKEVLDMLNNNPEMNALFVQADSLSRIGDIKAAEKIYKQVLKINDKSYKAFRWFGDVAFYKKDWGDVKKWNKKILKILPKDLEANYCLGIAYRETGKTKNKLIKALQFKSSRKYFEAVIESNRAYKDVLYQRGLLERWKTNWTQALQWGRQQIALKPNVSSTQVGLFKLYRLFLMHSGGDEIKNWLADNSGDWSTYILGEHFRRKNDFVKADSIFQDLLQKNIAKLKEPIYLSLVRLNVQKENQQAANKYFQLALKSISNQLDVDFLFEDSKYIFTDDELIEYKRLNDLSEKKSFFQRFWNSRDPMPASPINMRALEHFKRMMYAEKHYWYDGPRFWGNNPNAVSYLTFPNTYNLNQEFNDKGLIYIRHGAPDEFAITPSSVSNESWQYYPRPDRGKLIFHFLIEERLGVGNNWRLVPIYKDRRLLVDRLGWDTKIDQMLIAKSDVELSSFENQITDESRIVVKQAMSSDFHTWEKKNKEIQMPYFIANSRGVGDKTRVEICFGLPMKELNSLRNSNGRDGILEHGAGIYDARWDLITRTFEKVNLNRMDSTRIYKNYLVQKYTFFLKPETYQLAFHAIDLEDSRIAGNNVETVVPSFQDKTFSMSDLILAYEISPASERTVFTKGDISVIPNPAKIFAPSEPVYLYYEVYNLSKNQDGDTRYEIENEMTQLKKKKSGLKKVFGGGGSEKSISIRESRTGKRTIAIEYTSFDVSKLEQGEYKLTIKIMDLNSGKKTEKSINLTLEIE